MVPNKDQVRALEALSVDPKSITEDDVSEAGRIYVCPGGLGFLVDLDGSIERDD